MSDKKLKLITKEGESIEINRDHHFTTMCEFIKTVCDDGDFDTEEIKLSEIEANILVLAIDFCSRGPRAMLTKPKETTNKNIYKEEVSDWEYSFMEGIGFEQAQELLIAASYLDSPILIDACSAFIAHKLKQISIERFENTYNIDMNISSDKEIELMEKYKILIVDDPDSYFNAIK